jgi:hypothetical protein
MAGSYAPQDSPSLVEYLVRNIMDSCDPEHWERLDLGEDVINELDLNVESFELTDEEYHKLALAMDATIKDLFGDKIQEEVERLIKEGREDARELEQALKDAILTTTNN